MALLHRSNSLSSFSFSFFSFCQLHHRSWRPFAIFAFLWGSLHLKRNRLLLLFGFPTSWPRRHWFVLLLPFRMLESSLFLPRESSQLPSHQNIFHIWSKWFWKLKGAPSLLLSSWDSLLSRSRWCLNKWSFQDSCGWWIESWGPYAWASQHSWPLYWGMGGCLSEFNVLCSPMPKHQILSIARWFPKLSRTLEACSHECLAWWLSC